MWTRQSNTKHFVGAGQAVSIRWGGVLLFAALACLCTLSAAWAAQVSPDLEQLLTTSRVDARVDQERAASLGIAQPRVRHRDDGSVRFLSSTPGEYFEHRLEGEAAEPEEIALDFMSANAPVFGLASPGSGFDIRRVTTNNRIEFVRLQQTYRGIPVLGAEAMVHVIDREGVNAVSSNIMRDTAALDADPNSTVPSLSWDDAVDIAIQDTAKANNVDPSILHAHGEPELAIYDPSVVKGQDGQPVLTWKVRTHAHEFIPVDDDVYVNAHNGEVAVIVHNVCSALYRQVYNGFNILPYGLLAREEGDPAHSIAEVNELYEHMGATYDYYHLMHGRDSYDDSGSSIRGTIRSSLSGAWWFGGGVQRMTFQQGWAVDDVVAHEFTHGVTQSESGLLNTAAESGALNESFSDVWGEFIDLSYGTNPNPWEIGEDLPIGTVRYMDEPHNAMHPDRYQGTYWDATLVNVHGNGGVNNKLAHLLAEGDSSFYGSSYSPLDADLETSMAATIRLYYELQTNRLTSSSNYGDLGDQMYDAVIDAALSIIDLGNDIAWNAIAVQRVINAIIAVQI